MATYEIVVHREAVADYTREIVADWLAEAGHTALAAQYELPDGECTPQALGSRAYIEAAETVLLDAGVDAADIGISGESPRSGGPRIGVDHDGGDQALAARADQAGIAAAEAVWRDEAADYADLPADELAEIEARYAAEQASMAWAAAEDQRQEETAYRERVALALAAEPAIVRQTLADYGVCSRSQRKRRWRHVREVIGEAATSRLQAVICRSGRARA